LNERIEEFEKEKEALRSQLVKDNKEVERKLKTKF